MTQRSSTGEVRSPDSTSPGPFWRRRFGPRLEWAILLIFLLAVGALYGWNYYFSIYRPRLGVEHPLGWWGWYDQGQYLLSMQAFGSGAWSVDKFHYPPLYALLASPFWKLWPSHGAGVYDLILLLTYAGGLVYVARRFYGLFLPIAVCLAMLAFMPMMTLLQWVIPWTSSLSAAIEAVLVVLFFRAEQRAEPFALRNKRSWTEFVLFFLVYGALAPTRPMDIIAWFPFALAYFVRTLIADAKGRQGRELWLALLRRGVVAGVTGGVVVASYLAFNLIVEHLLFGTYAAAEASNGYLPKELVERILSMFWNAQPLYAGNGDDLFHKFRIFLPILSICAAALFFVRDVRFWVLISIFLCFVLSIPYGDFLPTGFFHTFLLHYFKFAYIWVGVIAAGQIALWLEGVTGSRRASSLAALATAVAVLAVAWNIDIQQRNAETAPTVRSAAKGTVTIDVARRRSAQFVDMLGLDGGPLEFALSPRGLVLDGRAIPPYLFRLYPIPGGGRMVLLRPMTFQHLVLTPGALLKISDGVEPSTVGSVSPVFGCRFVECTPIADLTLAWQNGVIDFDLRQDHPRLKMTDWSAPEPWGRWTSNKRGRLEFYASPPAHDLIITTRFGALIGGVQTKDKIWLWVNNCQISKTELHTPAKVDVTAVVPHKCLRSDGRLRIEWRTAKASRPVDVKLNPDTRRLAVAVEKLTLRETR